MPVPACSRIRDRYRRAFGTASCATAGRAARTAPIRRRPGGGFLNQRATLRLVLACTLRNAAAGPVRIPSKMARDAAVIARAAHSFRMSGSSRLGDRPFRAPVPSLIGSLPGGLAAQGSCRCAPSPNPFAAAGTRLAGLLTGTAIGKPHPSFPSQVRGPRVFLTRDSRFAVAVACVPRRASFGGGLGFRFRDPFHRSVVF